MVEAKRSNDMHMFTLKHNFRSTPAIVKCGNSLVQLLHRHFPHAIDLIASEESTLPGSEDESALPLLVLAPSAPLDFYQHFFLGSGSFAIESARAQDLTLTLTPSLSLGTGPDPNPNPNPGHRTWCSL